MADKKKDGQPEPVKLPGDEIIAPVELDLPLERAPVAAAAKPVAEPPEKKPGSEPAPVAAAPDKGAKPAAAAEPTKEEKPAEAQGNGPHNNYGVAEPTSSSPDAWLDYDEKLLLAKDAYEKEQKAKGAADPNAPVVVPKPGEGEPPKPADEFTPPPPREAPATLAADEKFALEPGAEWTRSQIVNEIVALRKIRDDREKTFALFGFDPTKDGYARFEAGWKPFLDKARENPGLVPFLDKMQDDFFRREEDPDYAAFMDENQAKYDEFRKEHPLVGGVRKPPATKTDAAPSAEMQRITALEQQLANERTANANRANLERVGEQIKTERLGLWKTYPVLQEETALWSAIKNHAILVATRQREETGKPATYTLTDAVRDQWPLVLKFMENRKVAAAAQVDGAPVPVRSGGQEGATVRTADDPQRERIYASSADAARAWYLEHPDGFTG